MEGKEREKWFENLHGIWIIYVPNDTGSSFFIVSKSQGESMSVISVVSISVVPYHLSLVRYLCMITQTREEGREGKGRREEGKEGGREEGMEGKRKKFRKGRSTFTHMQMLEFHFFLSLLMSSVQ